MKTPPPPPPGPLNKRRICLIWSSFLVLPLMSNNGGLILFTISVGIWRIFSIQLVLLDGFLILFLQYLHSTVKKFEIGGRE